MDKWEESMALDLEAGSPESLLNCLLLKDLLHGGAFDVEVDEPPVSFKVDYLCGDELEDGTYRLLIAAEVEGPEDRDLIRQFTEELLSELMDEASDLAAAAELVGEEDASGVELRAVPEDEERWDLVAPDWLAPDGAEVPFGFRSFKAGGPWPDDATLERHGRIVLVPFEGRMCLYGTPLPADEEEEG